MILYRARNVDGDSIPSIVRENDKVHVTIQRA